MSFDKDDPLLDNNRSDVTIKLIDENCDAHNFKRGRSAQFDLDDDEQTFTPSISSRKRRHRMRINPSTQKLDNEGPVFSSGHAGSVDENVDPDSLVYDADASDASAVSDALNGGDSASFLIPAKSPSTTLLTSNPNPPIPSTSSPPMHAAMPPLRRSPSASMTSRKAKRFNSPLSSTKSQPTISADLGMLLYSASGNFSADAHELLKISAVEGANFVPTRKINVI